MPKKDYSKENVLLIRVTAYLKKRIKLAASLNGMNVSEWIRYVVRKELERQDLM
jgi:predicted DNA binding CopG/RHH family protein